MKNGEKNNSEALVSCDLAIAKIHGQQASKIQGGKLQTLLEN